MFVKKVIKILFIISYLKEMIFYWVQFRMKDYLNNEKKKWEIKTF